MASNKFRWISAAETCHIWDESLDVIHKFDGVHGRTRMHKHIRLLFSRIFQSKVMWVMLPGAMMGETLPLCRL